MASTKTEIVGTLLHHEFFIYLENNGGRCNQLCRSKGEQKCCLSVVKGNENKGLHFEEIARGKLERTRVCFTMKTMDLNQGFY